MIIGNGLLAKAFKAYKEHKDILIFASGVSNSKSDDAEAFLREHELLKKTIQDNQDKKIIYFSTTSVKDEDMQHTLYVQHKIKTEAYIQEHAKRHTIFRLSEVVGNGGNKNTIMNFLYHSIKDESPFDIWMNACRRLTDVEDVFKIADEILQNNLYTNETVNISIEHKTYIKEVVLIFEKLLKKKALYNEVDKGNCYNVSLDKTRPLKSFQDINSDENYNLNLIKKYFINS